MQLSALTLGPRPALSGAAVRQRAAGLFRPARRRTPRTDARLLPGT